MSRFVEQVQTEKQRLTIPVAQAEQVVEQCKFDVSEQPATERFGR